MVFQWDRHDFQSTADTFYSVVWLESGDLESCLVSGLNHLKDVFKYLLAPY